MYEAVSVLLEVVSAMFQGYCMQYFYGCFLEGRMRNRRMNGLASAVFYGTLRLAAGSVIPQDNGSFGIFIRLAVSAGMASAGAFYRGGGKMRLFLTTVFMAVSEISAFLAYTAGQSGNALIALWGWCVEKEFIVSASVLSAIVHVTVIGSGVLMFLVLSVVMYCPLRSVAKAFQEKSYRTGNTELLFLITPGLTGILICSLLRAVLLTMEDGAPKQMYDTYPSLVILVPVILILSLVSIVAGVKLFQGMIDRNRERSRRMILEKQITGLQEHMGEMERVYSGIRGMRHDMKNTLSIMMRLAAGKEEILQSYAEELNQTLDRLEFRFKTGNPVADTLLNMKYHEAKREIPGITLDADRLLFPQELEILSYDLGIILGNALDNAIEACGRLIEREPEAEAFIRLSSWMKGKLLILKVENSFDGKLSGMGTKRLLPTNKTDKNAHGIGLSNIRCTAEKYGGTMDYKAVGRVFILSVMMKNERGNGNGA